MKDPEADYEAEKSNEANSFHIDVDGPAEVVQGLVGPSGRGSIRACDGPMLGKTDECIEALAPETSTRPREPRSQNVRRKVCFHETVDAVEVPAYVTIYGVNPRFIAATNSGLRSVSHHVGPYTSNNEAIMRARRAKTYLLESKIAAHRCKLMHDSNSHLVARLFHLLDGKIRSNPMTAHDVIFANQTPPANNNKSAANRQGAKAVKKMEQISDAYPLIRTLSACAKYLFSRSPGYWVQHKGTP